MNSKEVIALQNSKIVNLAFPSEISNRVFIALIDGILSKINSKL